MRPTTGIRLSWPELRKFLHQHLTEHVLPFWFPKLIDPRYGGLTIVFRMMVKSSPPKNIFGHRAELFGC